VLDLSGRIVSYTGWFRLRYLRVREVENVIVKGTIVDSSIFSSVSCYRNSTAEVYVPSL